MLWVAADAKTYHAYNSQVSVERNINCYYLVLILVLTQQMIKKPDIIKFSNQIKSSVGVLEKIVATYCCKKKINR